MTTNHNSPFKGKKPIKLAAQVTESLKVVYSAVSSMAYGDVDD